MVRHEHEKGGASVKAQRTPSRAVVEGRAPSRVDLDDRAAALFRELDYFPTPPWAARAIAYRLKQYDPGACFIGEPACGEGHFAEPLREVFGDHMFASDIYDYGYGAVGDFFSLAQLYALDQTDWIVTNPPFSRAADFVEHGLRVARRGVIVLCRTAFLESCGREVMLYESASPLTCIMPFVERVPIQLGSWNPDLSSATSYSAFVFHKGRAPLPHMPFKSGTRQTYTRDTDAARFAKPAPIPLFDKMASTPLFHGENA